MTLKLVLVLACIAAFADCSSYAEERGRVTWNGDFSTGDLSQYSVQSFGDQVVKRPAEVKVGGADHRFAAQLTTTGVADDGLRRVHLHGPAIGREGARNVYGNSVMIPADFPGGPGHQLLLEFFGAPWSVGPPVSLGLSEDGTQFVVGAKPEGAVAHIPVERDVWHDFVWQFTWSSGSEGRMALWHRIYGEGDYEQITFEQGPSAGNQVRIGPNKHPDSEANRPIVSNYHADTGPRTVFHSQNRAGTSFDAVAPR